MNKLNNSRTLALATLALVITFIWVSVVTAPAKAGQSSRFEYGTSTLIGASPAEVGEFAVTYAQHQLVVHGTPEVLISRTVTREEIASLGLGCINFSSIEEPPLRLVIMKGDFDLSHMPGTTSPAVKSTWQAHYVAYVFDAWAAQATYLTSSRNGGRFRQVLGDQSLAEDYPGQASTATLNCPTDNQPKHLHYGEVAPPATLNKDNR